MPLSVFHRPLYLAGILDLTADNLSRFFSGYDWFDRTQCNCGQVAQVVMQTRPVRLKKLLPPVYLDGNFYSQWVKMTERFCPVVGLPENEVFRRLLQAGMQRDDFFHLEVISHPEIRSRMDIFRRKKGLIVVARKTDVMAYLRAWATGIEAWHDGAQSQVETFCGQFGDNFASKGVPLPGS